MNKLNLTWLGEQAEIGGVGNVTNGKPFNIDVARAQSFIRQGKACLTKDVKVKTGSVVKRKLSDKVNLKDKE